MQFEKKPCIAVIGLGYVGLPLAMSFANKFQTIAYDINENRIHALRKGNDVTGEMSSQELLTESMVRFYL